MVFKVFSDGASRGNPGEAGCGFVIQDETGGVLYEGCLYIGHATNNVAEYRAVLEAARKVVSMSPSEIQFYLDSELIVKQMKGEYKVKNETLAQIRVALINALGKVKYSFCHVPRGLNSHADKLANKAIDEKIVL